MKNYTLTRASINEVILKHQAAMMNAFAEYKVKVGIWNIPEKAALAYHKEMNILSTLYANCSRSTSMEELEKHIEKYSKYGNPDLLQKMIHELGAPTFGSYSIR
jgi:DNA-binding response OmpR family regulator